ncbi:MAG: acyl-CoA dehydratase activase [Planctomycetota bacterium]|jgi:predicted CoA-substrate-specific enzyme activase
MSRMCAGIDAGSRAIKVVLIDGETLESVATGITDQGIHQEALAMALLDGVLAEKGLTRDDLDAIVATGYGRNGISAADTTVTEITCHARGVRQVCPEARTVVEIGGQDSKFIHLNTDGSVHDFAMNDRCAAGTGRFLEMVAARLDMHIDGLGDLAGASQSPAAISSMCVVFAETEIIGLLARGVEPADIAAGVQHAVAARVCAMGGRDAQAPVALTGGVALIGGMDSALAAALGRPVATAPTPQMTGALGAAVFAARAVRH